MPRPEALRATALLGLAAAVEVLVAVRLDTPWLGAPPATVAPFQAPAPLVGAALGLALAGAILYAGSPAARPSRLLEAALAVGGVALAAVGAALGMPRLAAAGALPAPALAVVPALLGVAAAEALLRAALRRRAPRVAANLQVGVWVALLAAGYVAVRPLLAARVPFLPPVEYMAGLALAALLLRHLLRLAAARAPALPVASPAVRHEPRVDALADPRFEEARRVVAAWVEHGEGREAYEALLARSLDPRAPARAVAEARAHAALPPLRPAPRWRPGARRRALEQAREARLAAHHRFLASADAARLRGRPKVT